MNKNTIKNTKIFKCIVYTDYTEQQDKLTIGNNGDFFLINIGKLMHVFSFFDDFIMNDQKVKFSKELYENKDDFFNYCFSQKISDEILEQRIKKSEFDADLKKVLHLIRIERNLLAHYLISLIKIPTLIDWDSTNQNLENLVMFFENFIFNILLSIKYNNSSSTNKEFVSKAVSYYRNH